MSCTVISDGTGDKYKAKVNSENRLLVSGHSTTSLSHVSEAHDLGFALTSDGFVSFSSAGEKPLLYIKNTDSSKHLHIFDLKVSCTEPTAKWRLYSGITGGTIISSPVNGNAVNLKLGATTEAVLDIFKGAEGKTFTGGQVMDQWINAAGPIIINYDGALIIPKNQSLLVTIEISAAASAGARFLAYYEEQDKV